MAVVETLSPEDTFASQIAEAGLSTEKVVEAVEPAETETAAEVVAEVEAPESETEVAAAEEFFPGYKDLPEESKALVRDSMETAQKAREYQQLAGKAEADRRATIGKLAPAQRELEEARAKLREFEKSQATSRRSGTKDVLEKFKSQYPDEAEALEAVNSQFETFAEQAEREREELAERFKALEAKYELQKQEAESREAIRVEREKLKEVHPDYEQINDDPAWKSWLNAIEAPKREFFDKNRRNAEVMASILTDFKRDRELARFLDQQNAGTATPNTPAKKPLARSAADPNPTTRRTTAIPHSNPTGSMDGEDKFSAELEIARAAGFNV